MFLIKKIKYNKIANDASQILHAMKYMTLPNQKEESVISCDPSKCVSPSEL
jgi:hypothetical protein